SVVVGLSGMSLLLNRWVGEHLVKGIPNFTVAYLVALMFFLVFKNTKVYDHIDTRINNKISGTATDYLVFFGISSIIFDAVVDYAGPLIVLIILGCLITLFFVYPLGKIYNKLNWFERSIFVFGYCSGTYAIGFLLLRIVDPDNQSKTISDTALTPVANFIEIIVWSSIPILLANGESLPIIYITIGGIIVC